MMGCKIIEAILLFYRLRYKYDLVADLVGVEP
jgi:hypothetical protein